MFTGIDLTDEYIAVFSDGDEEAQISPASLCRQKDGERWAFGEEALRETLSGNAVLSEKLLRLSGRDGTQTIGDRTYSSAELFAELFRLAVPKEAFSPEGKICVSLHRPDRKLMDRITKALLLAGAGEENILVTSHEEAFLYYVLSRDKELYSRMTCLFELHDGQLSYYEFLLARGTAPQTALCSGEDLEAFHPDILKNEAGRVLADRIVTEIARHSMEKKLFSGVFLTGEGFEETSWAPNFLSYVCQRRRVLQEKGLFAIGAAALARTGPDGHPYKIFCDQRISSEVSCEVELSGKKSKLILFASGERWYGQTVHAELILRNENAVDFQIKPFDRDREKRVVRAELSSFPENPSGSRRIAADLTFLSRDRVTIKITDLGFGDICPASGMPIEEETEI